MLAEEVLKADSMHPTDLEQVLAIERVSFIAPWSRAAFEEELANRHSRLIVFRIHWRIVGYMCFWQVMDEAHLLNIAVLPDMRRAGLGKSMMEHLEAVCRETGLKRILLDVARRNTAARRLYKKCGFRSIGFRKKYYPEAEDDALVMEKWLSSVIDEDSPSEEQSS